MSSLTDNLWSNIRWQWWQWVVLGIWKRTTTWFHHWSCPRCFGRPVTSHLGNPLNSWFTFFRLSLVNMHSTQNMILICTSKGNTLPNGLFWGSTNPLQFMMTTPSMKVTSPLRAPLIILIPPPITHSRQDLFSLDEKVYPWGVPPRVSFRSRHPHVMPLHQSAPWVWLIPLCSVSLFNMVKSLQALVLYSVPITVLMDMLSTLWNLPMGRACLIALFHRSRSEDLTRLAKQLPWDHPIARTLDHEVHRRKMAGKSNRFFGRLGLGPFPHTFFRVPFLDSLTTLEDRPVCLIYQWVAHPTYRSVCNHCARMMDGLTIDDLISGNRTSSLTKEDVVAYVRAGDPTNQDWDDWPLCMTYRINRFLLANRDHPDPDIDLLNAF